MKLVTTLFLVILAGAGKFAVAQVVPPMEAPPGCGGGGTAAIPGYTGDFICIDPVAAALGATTAQEGADVLALVTNEDAADAGNNALTATANMTGLPVGALCVLSFDYIYGGGDTQALNDHFPPLTPPEYPTFNATVNVAGSSSVINVMQIAWTTFSTTFTATSGTAPFSIVLDQLVDVTPDGSTQDTMGFLFDDVQIDCEASNEEVAMPILPIRCPSCEHTRARLDRAGPGETYVDKLGNSTFIPDERELRARTNWNYLDLGSSEVVGADLIDLAYYRGRDMAVSRNGLWGLMGGLEAGQFDYSNGGEVTKLGLAIGAYAARTLGNAGVLDTSLTAAYFENQFTSATGASADVGSLRLQWNGGLSGTFGADEGWQFAPALDLALVQETFDAFNLGGTAVAKQVVESGEASLSFDFLSPIQSSGRFTFGLSANQPLGNGFSAVGDVTADLSVGWLADTMDKTVRKIELTASDIAGDVTDYRLTGIWESVF